MIANEGILARINELKTAMAAGVVDSEIRKRNHRVQVLQGSLNRMLALIEARSVMYGNQLGEGRRWIVHDEAEEKQALSEGFAEELHPDKPVEPGYPKRLFRPGYPNGGATGMLVKDYRGKNAEQEIWKFDAALVSTINDTLKQAAIEEGQWTEKRALSGAVGISVIKARLNAGRDRIAAEKRAADEASAKQQAIQ